MEVSWPSRAPTRSCSLKVSKRLRLLRFQNAIFLHITRLLADMAMQWHCRHQICRNLQVGKDWDLPRCRML